MMFDGRLLVMASLQLGCVHFLGEEQRQVMEQLNREVVALQLRNERLSEEAERCERPEPDDAIYEDLRQVLGNTELRLSFDEAYTEVLIPGALLFSRESTTLRSEAAMELDLLSMVLHRYPDHGLHLVAHVDSTPLSSRGRRTYEDHWNLAFAQAGSVMSELTERYGLDATRFTLASRGAVEPMPDDGYAEDRIPDWRVSVRIIPPLMEDTEP